MALPAAEALPPDLRRISPHLRVADVDGLTMVMDLRTSAFYLLDDEASSMWKELRAADGSVIAAKKALGHGDESSRRLAGMFDDFVASCESRGFLLAHHPSPACGVPRRRWVRRSHRSSLLTVRAWLSMVRTDIALRTKGFAAIYERLGHTACVGPQSAGGVELAVAAFLRAENFYVRRRAPNDCLPRSLCLYAYLGSLGVPVVHRIGARRFPVLQCHAWVEYEGAPILDHHVKVSDYTLIASI